MKRDALESLGVSVNHCMCSKMTTSHYGTTGLLKNAEGEIVSSSIKVKVALVYLALVLDNVLLTVVGM